MWKLYGRKHIDINYSVWFFEQWLRTWSEIVCDGTSDDWNHYLICVMTIVTICETYLITTRVGCGARVNTDYERTQFPTWDEKWWCTMMLGDSTNVLLEIEGNMNNMKTKSWSLEKSLKMFCLLHAQLSWLTFILIVILNVASSITMRGENFLS